jgi:hypothetical protein
MELVKVSSPITAVRRVLGLTELRGLVILLPQVAGVDVVAKPQVALAKPQVTKPQAALAKPQVALAKPQAALAKPVLRPTGILNRH